MATITYVQRIRGGWGLSHKVDLDTQSAISFIKSMWHRNLRRASKIGDKTLLSIGGTLTEISEVYTGAGYTFNNETLCWNLPKA